MASALDRDQQSYRRGLVLGFTMAEIFVLVVFCLLLVWMIGSRRDRDRRTEIDRLRTRVTELQSQVALLVPVAHRNEFDDLFRELTRLRQEAAEATRRAAALEEASAALARLAPLVGGQGRPPAEVVERAREQLAIGQAVLDAARERSVATSETEVRRTVTSLVELQRQMEGKGMDLNSITARLRNSDERVRDVEGRLRFAERQLQATGRGTEWPACWADSTGRPEYIFDIALTSRSLVMRDAVPSDRREAFKNLPVGMIRTDYELGLAAFRDATRSLFEWSEKEHCRFFVRVYDTTGPTEKAVYKLHLRTVGEHFYYYEELRAPWNGTSAQPSS